MQDQRSARDVAEAKFAAKHLRHQEAQRAMSEYEAENRRVDEKTARLRALRLAREADVGKPGQKTKTPAARAPANRRKRSAR